MVQTNLLKEPRKFLFVRVLLIIFLLHKLYMLLPLSIYKIKLFYNILDIKKKNNKYIYIIFFSTFLFEFLFEYFLEFFCIVHRKQNLLGYISTIIQFPDLKSKNSCLSIYVN